MSGYIPESTLKRIRELQKIVEQNRNNTIFTAPVNDNIPSYGNSGSQNAAVGPTTGINVAQPIYHFVDSVSSSIQLASHNVVADIESDTAILLKNINGLVQDGTKILLTVRQGKTLTIAPGGNIAVTVDTILSDIDLAYLTFSKELGKFKLLTSSSTPSAVNWSDVIIDTNKDMLGFSLTNLGSIGFKGASPSQTEDEFILGNFMHYDFADTITNNIGFEFSINGSAYFQIVKNTASTPFTNFLFANVPFNMNNFTIYNIDDLRFNSTGLGQQINTSGDGKVFNFFVNGIGLMTLSPETSFNGGVLEVLTDTTNSNSFSNIKIVNLYTPVSNNKLLGEYSFDGKDDGGSQQSYFQIRGYAQNTNIANLSGTIYFQTWNNAIGGSPILSNIMSLSGDTVVGIGMNMQGNAITNVSSLQTPLIFSGSNSGQLNIEGGTKSTGSGGDVVLYGKTNVLYQGRVVFTTPNAAGTADIERMWISGMAATGAAGVQIFEFLNMEGNQIFNVLDPTQPQSAVTVHYASLNYADVHLDNITSTSIPTALLPDASAVTGRNLGSPTKYWLNEYVTQIFLGTDNATWFVNSTGDISVVQAANKKFRWTNSSGVDTMTMDPTTGFLNLNYPVFGIGFMDISGIIAQIFKLGSGLGLNYNVGHSESHFFQINAATVFTIGNTSVISTKSILPSVTHSINFGSVTNAWNIVHTNDVKVLDNSNPSNIFVDIGYDGSDNLVYNSNDLRVGGNPNHLFKLNTKTIIGVETDNSHGDGGYLSFHQTTTYTSASTGASGATPAQVVGYVLVIINGVERKIPYYAF